jgi:NAD+-dependent secondary alcohol dehydrogenase Adh1
LSPIEGLCAPQVLHTQTYPLDAVNDAMDDLDGGRLQGRGILIP